MNPVHPSTDRIQKLRSELAVLKVDAFLITLQPHLRYISGFSGSAGVGVVTLKGSYLVTDGRYKSQAAAEAKAWTVVITPGDLFEQLKRRKILTGRMRVAFDGNALIFSQFQKLKSCFPQVKFLPKNNCIEKIAAVKDPGEIESIRKAVSITDRVFTDILAFMKPGVSELDIAAEISYRHRKYGAEKDSFETIVASGTRSSLPHGRASGKKLRYRDLVTLDFGCVIDGYMSDMTRTVSLGKPRSEARKIYGIVLDAQLRAIDASRSGVKAKEIDGIARNFIQKKGYKKYFPHSLGHGIGLQIHEQPRLSRLSDAVLESGNVVTIEPGIYIPDFGGVRIEDDIVITDRYCEVLTKSPKELLVL